MPTPKERALEAAQKEASEIANKQDLSDEETADLEKRVETIEGLKSQVTKERELRAAIKDVIAPASDEEEGSDNGDLYFDGRTPGKSLGEVVAKSPLMDWLKQTKGHGESPAIEVRFKAEPTIIDLTTAGGSGLVPAQRVGGLEGLPSFPLSVADMLPSIPTNATSVSYEQEKSETSSIAGVAEGAEKPNFTLDLQMVTEEVEVIAGMAAVSRQMLEDAPFIAGFINSRLTYKLRQFEEDQIIDGTGTAPQLDGFLSGTANRTISTQVQGGDSVLDAIYKAADKCFVAGGYPADTVVVHPTDWQPIRLSKDDVSRYYGDGPFGSILGDTIWGLRVVKSTQITAGTVLVGAFRQAAFLARNGGLTIRTSDSHSDYFKKNKVAILIEERVALGVPAPLAICKLTLA